jgi:hypothetical protein
MTDHDSVALAKLTALRRKAALSYLSRARETADQDEATALRVIAASTFVSTRDVEAVAALIERNDALAQRLDNFLVEILRLAARVAALETRAGVDVPAEARPALITIKMASFRTGYSPSAIRKRIEQGKIRAQKLGGRVLCDETSLPTRRAQKSAIFPP